MKNAQKYHLNPIEKFLIRVWRYFCQYNTMPSSCGSIMLIPLPLRLTQHIAQLHLYGIQERHSKT